MSATVSRVGLSILGTCALCHGYAYGDTAVSSAAALAREHASYVVASVESSQALFGEKARALAELATLAAECAVPGWDGDAAQPLDDSSVSVAARLIRALPDGVTMPECAADPDGAVSLDWIASTTRVFTLSVGRNSRLAFAWVDGSDSGHGVARFNGVTVPPRILSEIRAVGGDDATPFRA